MAVPPLATPQKVIIECQQLQQLIEVLGKLGFQVVGPRLNNGAIVYDEVRSVDDLPAGWTDQQEAGSYRLHPRTDAALFGYVVGPHSWKKFLHPSQLRFWTAKRNGKGFQILDERLPHPRYAFLGVRACEIAAIAIQDKVFLEGDWVDPHYKARRESALIIAVNCGQAGGTCFCASMNTGPRVSQGFDLAMTEVVEKDEHYFVVEVGTPRGGEIVAKVPHKVANKNEVEAADAILERTAHSMGRHLDTTDLQAVLYRSHEHPRWDETAARCLTCANCTMVCPTCFCTTVEDVTDLGGGQAERWRKWDSCFTMDFSYIHGGSVRASPKSRYRQWLMHKLATWIDQFGMSGCVGCGRCITWCPVAIDITAEARAIRQSEPAETGTTSSKEKEND